ncbi:hypothetical protein PRIPAC_89009 [Pristionchus pacificus]|uniref:Uncharacterized protein n=1 Tax=Pristionchus pacificus TaxID=54126 RepID=A0A2A6CVW7_PRIPA|nr:hypothetical protein PRIPAC_89009 [Pristionchus pacificus]|eukprot:PDM82187.1 hypothetical protein PRIPAC_36580 [Pristionchus pacificus]
MSARAMNDRLISNARMDWNEYEAVCERVEQAQHMLALIKNVDSLKISNSGFSKVLMTMGIVIFHIESPVAPGDHSTLTTISAYFLTPIFFLLAARNVHCRQRREDTFSDIECHSIHSVKGFSLSFPDTLRANISV